MPVIRYSFVKNVDFGPKTDPVFNFESLLFARKIKNLLETGNRFQKYFPKIFLYEKIQKALFLKKCHKIW